MENRKKWRKTLMDGLSHTPHSEACTLIKEHHHKSAHDHDVTHHKLDEIEEDLEEIEECVKEQHHELHKAIKEGRELYHQHSSGSKPMYDHFGGGSLIGAGIGGFGGALIASLFGRGGFGGGWGGNCGGGCGCGGRGCDCCCQINSAETRIEDRIDSASSTQQHFDTMMTLGGIKQEVALTAGAVAANINRTLFEMQIAMCQNNATQLMAIEKAQYASVNATKDAQYALATQAAAIAYEQLKQCCDRDRCEHDRRFSEQNITMISNQNQNQLQLLEAENRRRADRSDFQFSALNALFNHQFQNAATVSKSVNFGSGTATNTNTSTQNQA